MRNAYTLARVLERLWSRRTHRATPDMELKEFYATLEQQLIQVHERQRQQTAGLWRATDECPTMFRIQAGELSSAEIRHVKNCHLCWLIYDLTRVERFFGSLSTRARRTVRWLGSSRLVPVTGGLIVIIGLLFRIEPWAQVEAPQLANGNQPASFHRLTQDMTPSAAAVPKVEFHMIRERELRQLAPQIEIQRRLGPRFAVEFESLRETMSIYVPPNSQLNRSLEAAWLETLRAAGNGLFVEIVRNQIAFASAMPPEALVELAEFQANLAAFAGQKYLREFMHIQVQDFLMARKELGRTKNASLIPERVREEAVRQRDAASPTSLGQAAALREAKMRHNLKSSFARK